MNIRSLTGADQTNDLSNSLTVKSDTSVKDTVDIRNSDEPAKQKKKWTVMLYSAGDNNLKTFLYQDANELEKVGSDENTNMIAQLDQGHKECGIFELKKDEFDYLITSPEIKHLGKTDMANPKVLSEFIKFSMDKYPAENYALIMSDHGLGWQGAIEDSGSFSWMSLDEIKKGLETAKNETGTKIDLLGFDACLMANTEVAYQLKDQVKYIVASEQTEGAEGWQYTNVFTDRNLTDLQEALKKKIKVEPREFAKQIVEVSDQARGVDTLSATDTSKIQGLANSLKEFTAKILENKPSKTTLEDLIYSSESFTNMTDLGNFCKNIINSKELEDEQVKEAAKKVINELENTVIAEKHSSIYYNATGLTIQLNDSVFTSSEYDSLDFAKDTGWKNLIKYIYNK